VCEVVKLDSRDSFKVLRGAACAFGVFDGFHLGHRFIIDKAIQAARETDAKSVVLTFDIDPDELFAADRLQKLMDNDTRIHALSKSGVDCVAVFNFTREFAALEPEAFLEHSFDLERPASIHVGSDFRFGCRAKGDIEVMKSWGQRRGIDVIGYDLFEIGGMPVTSTRIRKLRELGDYASARDLLGHDLGPEVGALV